MKKQISSSLRVINVVLASALWLALGNAQATLLDRGGGLLYDSVLNVTWLQDANYAKTSGYDADGKMSWYQAKIWTDNLVFHDSVRNVDYSDWRLPSLSPVNAQKGWGDSWSYDGISSDRSFNVTSVTSELGYMYYVNLGRKGEFTPSGVPQTNFGIFENGFNVAFGTQGDVGLVRNIQAGVYWYGNELVSSYDYLPASDYAWLFGTYNGAQYFGIKTAEPTVWAVRDGDVAQVSPVPEPATYTMLLTGLSLLGFTARRRKNLPHNSNLS